MPRKRKTTEPRNAVGRPPSFGLAQRAHVDSRQLDYNALRNDKTKTQSDMTKFLDDETFFFFGKFGWEDPERYVPADVAEPAPDMVNIRREEANKAKRLAKGKTASDEHKRRDRLVKHVRTVSVFARIPFSRASS